MSLRAAAAAAAAAAAGALSDRARQLFARELWSTVGGDDIVAQR